MKVSELIAKLQLIENQNLEIFCDGKYELERVSIHPPDTYHKQGWVCVGAGPYLDAEQVYINRIKRAAQKDSTITLTDLGSPLLLDQSGEAHPKFV